ncbi:MAG TPA: hypothetical protein VNT42_11935 [Sphingomonas sp.]|nr:hypothetical protein [Sphingomonas sp.]
MIVPKRLSAVGQVAGVAVAALCCYLASQSVAAERASLTKVDREIAATRDDIAKLQMEISVRGRMGQLERWNTEVLALQAPRPSQFVSNGVQLASLYGSKGQPALQLDPAIQAQQGAVDKVGYQPAAPQAQAETRAVAAHEATTPQPMLRVATFVRPTQSRLAASAPELPVSAPVVEKAAFQPGKPLASASRAPLTTKASAHASASLLPSDIGELAAHEAKGSRDSSRAAR